MPQDPADDDPSGEECPECRGLNRHEDGCGEHLNCNVCHNPYAPVIFYQAASGDIFPVCGTCSAGISGHWREISYAEYLVSRIHLS